MKKVSRPLPKMMEVANGKIIGGFSGVLNKFNSDVIYTNKNSGQCVVVNNCIAGSNCATSCSIFNSSRN